MAKRAETRQMAELFKQELNYRQIADLYGIHYTAVGIRLRKIGFSHPTMEEKARQIDGDRLRILYESDEKSLKDIAEIFGVTIDVIKYALKLNGISKRSPISRNVKYFDRLRELNIGEQIEIECRAKYPKDVFRSAARRLEFSLSIRKIGLHLYLVTRVDPNSQCGNAKAALIEKKILEELYGDPTLSLEKITLQLNCSIKVLSSALEIHQIPKRPRHWGFGKYTGIFKKMSVGDTAELNCPAKYPHINLHTIAARIGIKISIRKIAGKRFQITRLG